MNPLEDLLRTSLSLARADGLACSEMLYRHVSRQLSQEEEARFVQHLRDCVECRTDLVLFERATANKTARQGRLRGLFQRWLRPLLVTSLVGAVAFGVWRLSPHSPTNDGIGRLTPKGGPVLHIALRHGEQELTLAAGSEVEDGDELGFFYSAAAPTWPVVFLPTNPRTWKSCFPPSSRS